MTEQTTPSITEVNAARVARAADLKVRVLAAISAPETAVPAAIAARLMVGSYLLIKALSDSTLIYRKVSGDATARLPMLMQMMFAGIEPETLKVVAPRYNELVGPIADRLLDAAEARLNGEPVTGEEPDISVLADQRSIASQMASVSGDLAFNGDAETSSAVMLATWIAGDVSSLANSADSADSGASEEEFQMEAMGSENSDANDLRSAISDLPVEVLIGQVMSPYHVIIVPLIAELEATVDAVLPEPIKNSYRNSDASLANFDSLDAALDVALEKELANDPELAAALKAGLPLGEPVPRAADAETPDTDESKS